MAGTRYVRAGMSASNYRVVRETPAYLLIEDVGPWSGHPTVTNDAEQVVGELAPRLGARRLLYYDSDGELGELRHEAGRFAGFGFVAGLPDED